MKLALRSAIRLTADLLFPPRCVHCGSDGNLFCQACESESTRLRPGEVCRRCALPFGQAGQAARAAQGTCEACFLDPPALDRAIAAYAFDHAVPDAITAFKYNDIRALATRLGRLLAEALPDPARGSVDVLVPVPMSRSRLRVRGYNQSELLARQVSHIASLPLETGLLVRRRDSGPQDNAQSHSERAANMAGAFEVAGGAPGGVSGRRVLLIDDVMTTGATLNACARALKESGAEWVGALTLAREL